MAGGSWIAADAGVAMADGGNAVDAVLAASAVSLCLEPDVMCAAGSGFVTIWPRPIGGTQRTRSHPAGVG